jgi:alkyl hydroperoxide reductase subunit AhpC
MSHEHDSTRCVFLIGPDKRIKLIVAYPVNTGLSVNELLRATDSLQLGTRHEVATPVNWRPGEDVIIAGSVSDQQARRTYPNGWKALKPYLRIVPQPHARNPVAVSSRQR